MRRLGRNFRQRQPVAAKTLAQKVAAILRKKGTDATVWMPGIGIINGLTAGNYLDSAGITPITVDNPVGKVEDAAGSIDATQGTTANKPILRRGAVNLLTYSEQFDDVAWAKTALSVSKNAVSAPDGATTADKLIEAATTSVHEISESCTSVAGVSYTFSVFAKAAERSAIQLQFGNTQTTPASVYVNFDLSAGVIGTGTAGYGAISSRGNGWYKCSVTVVASGTTLVPYLQISNSASAPRNASYTGDGTSGIYIWGAQLQTGSVATDYVATTTAPASSPSGNYHWVFDSTDVLTATFPAGYESATIINTAETGQVTYTGQNIVGAYDIRGAVIGSELVTNGTFDTATTGWTVTNGTQSVVSGELFLENTIAAGTYSQQTFTTQVGKVYKLDFKARMGTATSLQVAARDIGGTTLSNVVISTVGDNKLSLIFTAISTTSLVRLLINTTTIGHTAYFDNVSVREVTTKEYARFIFRTGLTASELATMQTFANRLAGV